jgi:glycosyltransferase involved in cell wall biosynthesis
VVTPCFGQASFLAGAIESVLAQTNEAHEIIVVDDGSREDLSPIVSKYPGVRFIRQANRGLAGARNFGLREAKSDKIIFLDADDRLLPRAVDAGLECFREHPAAAFVYGAHEEVRDGSTKRCFTLASRRSDLVRFNYVGMIASAMFDRRLLLAHGGFDESLGMCEDWDAYLRLTRDGAFAAHSQAVAAYVKHAGNMSNDVPTLRAWVAVVRDREKARGLSDEERHAWEEGEAVWDAAYPRVTPAHLARRLVRRVARAFRELRAA